MSGKKIVLMNHTNMQGHHFGCARVMRLIEDGLTSRGCRVHGRLDGKEDWRKNPTSLRLLAECDGIVINGEGTLHHGRRKARRLLEVATHEVTRNKELSLINALWQENPDNWGSLLKNFAHVWARDSRSSALMARQSGRNVSWLGDLSMSAGAIEGASRREGILVGDSVSDTTTDILGATSMALSKTEKTSLVPLTVSWYEDNPFRSRLRQFLQRGSARRKHRHRKSRFPLWRFVPSEAAYIELLRESRLLVTGRFHGVCLALVTGTPFVTVTSNSWKIEALFEDAGIDQRRLVTRDALDAAMILGTDWSWSISETRNVAAFLEYNKESARRMFDEIAY